MTIHPLILYHLLQRPPPVLPFFDRPNFPNEEEEGEDFFCRSPAPPLVACRREGGGGIGANTSGRWRIGPLGGG